jgi:lipopolysaccharide export LptBFGC system permease protein LptF
MNANPPTIYGLSVFESADRPYRLTRHTHATQAAYVGGRWRARNGWAQEFSGDEMPRQDFEEVALALAPVEDFRRAQIDASQMTFGELREYVRRLGASGFNVADQRVNLHRKVAFPFVTLVMTLLAVPFGVTTGKKGALYGIGLAVVLAAGYFLLLTFFVAVGAAGVLPAWLAAWAANLFFAAGALYLMLTVRT